MRFIYFFLTVFIGGHCSAESSVWRVESADSIIYLGGTCHMLRASDWPLPAAYDFAYRQSEIMVFETNLERMEATDFQAQLLQRVQLPNGSTLQSVLSPHVYQELLDYCNANQLPIAVLQRLKPSFAMLSLALLEYQKLGVTQEGVDHHYLKRAHKDAKSNPFGREFLIGSTYAQCSAQTAPSLIHSSRTFFSFAVRGFPISGGGITSSSSSE